VSGGGSHAHTAESIHRPGSTRRQVVHGFEAPEPNLLGRPVMATIFTKDEPLKVDEDGSTSAVAPDEDEA
jgi:hypothetical protein